MPAQWSGGGRRQSRLDPVGDLGPAEQACAGAVRGGHLDADACGHWGDGLACSSVGFAGRPGPGVRGEQAGYRVQRLAGVNGEEQVSEHEDGEPAQAEEDVIGRQRSAGDAGLRLSRGCRSGLPPWSRLGGSGRAVPLPGRFGSAACGGPGVQPGCRGRAGHAGAGLRISRADVLVTKFRIRVAHVGGCGNWARLRGADGRLTGRVLVTGPFRLWNGGLRQAGRRAGPRAGAGGCWLRRGWLNSCAVQFRGVE